MTAETRRIVLRALDEAMAMAVINLFEVANSGDDESIERFVKGLRKAVDLHDRLVDTLGRRLTMPRETLGPTGLKMSQLRTKQKPSGPTKPRKGCGEFPSMEDTNFFDPKSLNMRAGRGSSLPRRKAAPLEMEFNSVPGPIAARSRRRPRSD